MHVDSNNAGSSYIVVFGDYSGCELWIMDEQHDQECEVARKAPGYQLEGCDMVPGRLHNIRNP